MQASDFQKWLSINDLGDPELKTNKQTNKKQTANMYLYIDGMIIYSVVISLSYNKFHWIYSIVPWGQYRGHVCLKLVLYTET